MNYKILDKNIQKAVSQDKFSGCIYIADKGRPVFEKSYGFASKAYKVKNKIDTKFNTRFQGASAIKAKQVGG